MLNSCQPSVYSHLLPCLVFTLLGLQHVLISSWRRKWQPTPVLLPGKSHGWRSMVGYCPWGRKESDTIEWLHFHFIAAISLITLKGIALPLWNNMCENAVCATILWTGEKPFLGVFFCFSIPVQKLSLFNFFLEKHLPSCFSSAGWLACCGPSSVALPYPHQIMSCSGFLKLFPRCPTLSREGEHKPL